ncbi:MAG: acyl carrier protein [Bacteriovoracaceae bacterium]|nr:acyl carrier protein [Bacteriovoracaceae bacterium]
MISRNELLEHLISSIKKNAEIVIEEKDFDTDIVELGIDSIFAIEIANDIEEFLDIVIDDRDIGKFRSINVMLEYFDMVKKEKEKK